MRAGAPSIAPALKRGTSSAVLAARGVVQRATRTPGAPVNVHPGASVAFLAGLASIEPARSPGVLGGTGQILAASRHPIAALAGVVAPATASVGAGA